MPQHHHHRRSRHAWERLPFLGRGPRSAGPRGRGEDGQQRVLRWVQDTIERVGFAIITVGAAPAAENGGHAQPTFSYTVGLVPDLSPAELVIVGLHPEAVHGLFHTFVRLTEQGRDFVPGGVYTEFAQDHQPGDLPLAIRDVRAGAGVPPGCLAASTDDFPTAFADRWHSACGRAVGDYPLWQLIWSDPAGRFPWQPGFEEAMKPTQPLLCA